MRQRKPAPSPPSSSDAAGPPTSPSSSRATPALLNGDAATASGADKGKQQEQAVGDAVARGVGAERATEKGKVISPELRSLLSREVARLDKGEVVRRGGGVGS